MKGDGAPESATSSFVVRASLEARLAFQFGAACFPKSFGFRAGALAAPSRRLRQLQAALFVKHSRENASPSAGSRQASLISPGGALKPLLSLRCERTRRSAASRSAYATPREAPLRRAGVNRNIYLDWGGRMVPRTFVHQCIS